MFKISDVRDAGLEVRSVFVMNVLNLFMVQVFASPSSAYKLSVKILLNFLKYFYWPIKFLRLFVRWDFRTREFLHKDKDERVTKESWACKPTKRQEGDPDRRKSSSPLIKGVAPSAQSQKRGRDESMRRLRLGEILRLWDRREQIHLTVMVK